MTTTSKYLPVAWARGAALLAAFTLAGCASPVLESRVITDFTQPVPGLVYALPKAQVEVQAERKVVKAADVAKAEAEAGAAVAAQAAAKARAEEAKASVKGLEAVLAKAEEAAKSELAKQLAIAKAVAAVAAAGVAQADAEVKKAKDNAEQLSRNAGQLLETASVKFLTPVPDPKYRFVVNRTGGAIRDDELKLTVSGGLLNSSDVSAANQAAAVLQSLVQFGVARSVGRSGPFRGPNLGFKLQQSKDDAAPATTVDGCREYKFITRFDPTRADESAKAAKELEDQSQGALKLTVTGLEQLPSCASASACLQAGDGKAPGLLYRALSGVELGVRPAAGQQGCVPAPATPFDAAIASAVVPDSQTLLLLPHEAGAFVKTVQKHSFKDGVPTELSINSPSQLAAIARIPIDILKAVFEIPTQFIQLRINQDTASNNLLLQQIAALDNQVKLLEAQKKLEERLASEP